MAEERKTGEVINLFTRKRVETEAAPPAEEPQQASEDSGYFDSNKRQLEAATDRVNEIERYISSLRGYARNERNINLRAEGVRDLPLAELAERLLNSTEAGWREKPSYYLALIGEFSARVNELGRDQGSDMTDTLYTIANSERVIAAVKRIDVATNYIFDEIGYVLDEPAVNAHRRKLNSHTLEQLVGILLDSAQAQWAQNPSYYGAVILETDDRTKRVQEVLYRNDTP